MLAAALVVGRVGGGVRAAGLAAAAAGLRPLAPLGSAGVLATVGASAVEVHVRHATSKAGGSTKNGRDSQPKYLGVKKFGGHWVEPGNIILRQRGQRYGIVTSTRTVALGKDWTICALVPGYVKVRQQWGGG
jgi:large subunit ribosomal protein L27